MNDPIAAWALTTCRALAIDPDAVTVDEGRPDSQYLEIAITPGAKNARRIIGVNGEVIKALRLLAGRMTPRPVQLLVLGPEYDAAKAGVAPETRRED